MESEKETLLERKARGKWRSNLHLLGLHLSVTLCMCGNMIRVLAAPILTIVIITHHYQNTPEHPTRNIHQHLNQTTFPKDDVGHVTTSEDAKEQRSHDGGLSKSIVKILADLERSEDFEANGLAEESREEPSQSKHRIVSSVPTNKDQNKEPAGSERSSKETSSRNIGDVYDSLTTTLQELEEVIRSKKEVEADRGIVKPPKDNMKHKMSRKDMTQKASRKDMTQKASRKDMTHKASRFFKRLFTAKEEGLVEELN